MKRCIFGIVIGMVVIGLNFYTPPSHIQALTGNTPLTITGGTDGAGDCGVTDNELRIDVSYDLTGTAVDAGSGEDVWFIAVFDAQGNQISNWIDSTANGSNEVSSVSTGNWGGVVSIVPAAARPFQARLIDPTVTVSDIDIQDHMNDPVRAISQVFQPTFSASCMAKVDYSAPPSLISPIHKARTTDTTPSFSWSSVPGALQYRILIQTEDASFLFKKVVSGTSYTVTTPLASSVKYIWRIRTKIDAFGIFGKWSQRNTLFVD